MIGWLVWAVVPVATGADRVATAAAPTVGGWIDGSIYGIAFNLLLLLPGQPAHPSAPTIRLP